jgi:hypothetical protein
MKPIFGANLGQTNVYVAAAAATIAVACGALMFAALSFAARPDHFGERLIALDSQATQAHALAGPADGGVYAKGAICRVAAADGAAQLQQVLARDANLAKTTLANVTVSPAPPTGARARLVPVQVQFEASGQYDGLLLFMNLLAQSRPQLFVDTIDLTPQLSVVSLKLKGRMFCSTSAPL